MGYIQMRPGVYLVGPDDQRKAQLLIDTTTRSLEKAIQVVIEGVEGWRYRCSGAKNIGSCWLWRCKGFSWSWCGKILHEDPNIPNYGDIWYWSQC